jgi:hypothetical protein
MSPAALTQGTGQASCRGSICWEQGRRVFTLASIGSLALALGLLVYLTDRDPASAALIPSVAALAGLQLFGAFGPWLPSLVHPFAFSLFTAAALPPGSAWRYHACVFWGVVNLAFEFGQHPQFSAPLAKALQAHFGASSTARMVSNYLLRGTFDLGDIAAAVLGAVAAAVVLRLLQPLWESDHAS